MAYGFEDTSPQQHGNCGKQSTGVHIMVAKQQGRGVLELTLVTYPSPIVSNTFQNSASS